ncbi:MAG: hypothetical protein APF76_06590 [Desulfitibacter sp. BRH_c19]|nr:MAG: hypothetical protein APF76_06590 [Desulfitibacter sp. BRH_c19]
MYKLLIVDDELIELQFLRYVIDKYKMPLKICGEAQNGYQAVELAEKFQPDFMIIDISMPHKNGLEAAAMIKEKYPGIKIYILTAYERFDYAKKAIEIDVEDYLSKPISPEKLINVLKRGIKSKLKEKLETSKALRLHNNLKTIEPNLKKQFVVDLINDNLKIGQEKVAKKILGIKDYNYTQILVATFVDEKSSRIIINETTITKIAAAINKSLDNGLYTVLTGGKLIVFGKKQLTKDMMKDINIWCSSNGYGIYAGVLTLSMEGNIHSAFNKANEICENALFWLNSGIHFSANMEEKSCVLPKVSDVQGEVFSAVLRKEYSFILELINRSLTVMNDTFCRKDKAIGFTSDLLTLIVCVSAKDILTREETEFFREKIASINNQLITVTDLKNAIENIISELCSKITPARISSSDYYINLTIDYIKQNYHAEVTLEGVAGKLFISPFYLSRIFKKQTGQGFAEVLTKTRIEKAKTLLMTGKFSVGEVGRQVGIHDPSYFSSVFKKHTSISPSKIIEDAKGQ